MWTRHDTTSISDLPYLDATAPGFDWEDSEVADARERHWAARTAEGLVVLRYTDVAKLLQDRRLVNDYRGFVEQVGVTGGVVHEFATRRMTAVDGRDHRRLRRLVAPAVTPARIAELRSFIRKTADRLSAELPREECDVMEAFAKPLPMKVTCHLLGLPLEDADALARWAKDAGLVFALNTHPGLLPRVEEGLVRLFDYVRALVHEREADPGDDLLSRYVRARREGSLSSDELHLLVVHLLVAATDTTSHQLTCALFAFARHPAQWELLRDRPDLLEQAVSEVLRWQPTSPVASARVAIEDFVHRGLRIPGGTSVWLATHAAHRDPRAFVRPDTFDIGVRRDAQPLVFNGGPHTCIGATLARAEIGEALRSLTADFKPPAIAGTVAWRPTIGTTGPDTLPLRLNRRLTSLAARV